MAGFFKRLGGIARNCEESPRQLPRFRIVGGYVAARAIFPAAVADDDAPFDHPRRLRDGVGLGGIHGHGAPQHLAGGIIQGHQPPIVGTHKIL